MASCYIKFVVKVVQGQDKKMGKSLTPEAHLVMLLYEYINYRDIICPAYDVLVNKNVSK